MCLQKANGTKIWATQIPIKARFSSSLLLCVAHSALYVCGMGHVSLLDLRTGSIKQLISLETKFSMGVCVGIHDGELSTLTASTVGRISLFQSLGGTIKLLREKNITTQSPITQLTHPSNPNIVFFAYSHSPLRAKVKAVNKSTLEPIWVHSISTATSPLVTMATCPHLPTSLFVATGGILFCLDMYSGEERGRVSLPDCGKANAFLMPLATVAPMLMASSVGHWYVVNATDYTVIHKSKLHGIVTGTTMFWRMNESSSGYLLDPVV